MTSPLNGAEVRVAGNGGIWRAPAGTALPADSVAVWGTGWVNVGYVEDGFKMKQSLKTQDILAWQTLERVRVINQELFREFDFTAIQSNKETVEMAWGGATITPGTGSAYTLALPDPAASQEFSLGLDWLDGATSCRIIVSRATLLTLPEVTYGRKDAVKYAMTVSALAPADGSASVRVYGVDAALVA